MIEYSPKNIRMWSMLGAAGTAGYVLNELAYKNRDLMVLTADLCFYSGLERFKSNHPDQFYNVGIAEQNMVAVGAAMAKEGLNVFATTYATFAASRALDQVRVNQGYMQLPLKILGLAAGLSGGILGATHMSCEDLAVMRSIPGMIVTTPADGLATVKILESIEKLDKPVYVRLEGEQRTPIVYKEEFPFILGKAVRLRKGRDVLIIACGSMVKKALDAAEQLEERKISCGVADMHTLKPLDKEFLSETLCYKLIVTLEEHSVIGGLGGGVAEYMSGLLKHPPLYRLGIKDYYPHAAPYGTLIEESGLSVTQIEQSILEKYQEVENDKS